MASEQLIEDGVIIAIREGIAPFSGHAYLGSQFSLGDYRIDVLALDRGAGAFVVVECKGGVATAGAIDQCAQYVDIVKRDRAVLLESLRTSKHLTTRVLAGLTPRQVEGVVVAERFDTGAVAAARGLALWEARLSPGASISFARPGRGSGPGARSGRAKAKQSRVFTEQDWIEYIKPDALKDFVRRLYRCLLEDEHDARWVVVQAKFTYTWVRYRGEPVLYVHPGRRTAFIQVLRGGSWEDFLAEASGDSLVLHRSADGSSCSEVDVRVLVNERLDAIRSGSEPLIQG